MIISCCSIRHKQRNDERGREVKVHEKVDVAWANNIFSFWLKCLMLLCDAQKCIELNQQRTNKNEVHDNEKNLNRMREMNNQNIHLHTHTHRRRKPEKKSPSTLSHITRNSYTNRYRTYRSKHTHTRSFVFMLCIVRQKYAVNFKKLCVSNYVPLFFELNTMTKRKKQETYSRSSSNFFSPSHCRSSFTSLWAPFNKNGHEMRSRTHCMHTSLPSPLQFSVAMQFNLLYADAAIRNSLT